ncbi:phosphatidate cytidylyltransferase [Lacipirellula sp.]|uniref:phosphatidate cytidylyltransferase n=1 Tax=Lacipirellula sp. TaxID=2691419 RepID=UPI003D09E537
MSVTDRLFDPTHAFDHPATVAMVAVIVIGLIAASIMIRVRKRQRRLSDDTYRELIARTRSWYILAAAMVVPILLGAAWVYCFFLLLSLFCFREFARATQLDESRIECASVVLGILVTYFALVDHWMGLFTASWAFGIGLVVVGSLLPDNPQGYIRRTAVAIVGFALFGISLGHLAYIANDPLFRPILLWLLICTELNDVFAYLCGKKFGRRKLLPNTSPNKTIAGALGAVLLTTLLAALLGAWVFRGTTVNYWPHLVMLGLMISILGQCGDLVISSIKRDLGVKDMSTLIPGHGGLLDRFDSLLIVAPGVFHYLNYVKSTGVGWDQPERIITGM